MNVWKNAVITVHVKMHVSYIPEPGKKGALMRDIKRTALEVPFESVTSGVNGTFSMIRKINGKHRRR
jgi:hypothetical protein